MTLQGWYGPDKLLRNYKKLIILSMEGLGKNSRASFQKLLDEVANCKKKKKNGEKWLFTPKKAFNLEHFRSPLPPREQF